MNKTLSKRRQISQVEWHLKHKSPPVGPILVECHSLRFKWPTKLKLDRQHKSVNALWLEGNRMLNSTRQL